MKKVHFLILIVIFSAKCISQELPPNFEDTIRNEYNSFSQEVIDNELKQNFEEYLALRKVAYLNKQQFYQSIASSRSVNNLCDNGTFESGINPSEWNFEWGGNQGTRGHWVSGVWTVINYTSSIGLNLMNIGSFEPADHPNSVHHQVQTSGLDNIVTAINKVWNYPTGNTKSVRLGNLGVSNGYESMAKVVNITPSNSILSFSYAMVVQNPGHGTNTDPSFRVNIIDANNPLINYNNLVSLGGSGINYITSSHPLLKTFNAPKPYYNVQYKNWSCVVVDLSSLIGKSVIIEFENKDCQAGGHWGYSYLDNICLGCEGSDSDEGSININQGQSSDCEIPGQICIDYTLPTGNNPSLTLELEIIQNGTVSNTLVSPVLTSGTTYCFNLNSINTSGLNTSLQGFDFKVTGKPKLDTFNLTPKIIGSSSYGLDSGINNDYDIFCPPNFDCCETELDIWNPNDGKTYPTPVQNTTINGIELGYSEEIFEIHQNATIPITELKVTISDIDFEYNYEQCAECINNPALWGSIFSTDNSIGTAPNSLQLTPQFSLNDLANNIQNGINTREIIWENLNGAMLQTGDKFKLTYILPPLSDIPCCATKVKICSKISWKDANCNVCEVYTCSEIDLIEKPINEENLSLKIQKKGCCEREIIAETSTNATYKWSTGATSSSITVTENGEYSVTVSAGGNSITKSILVSDMMTGDFPLLSFNSLFHPDLVPPYKNKFYIMDISPGKVNQGVPNSYNATDYKLEIWHRWNTAGGQGNPLKTISGTSSECNGFNNWDINWDGTDQSGASLKDEKADSYVWRLTLKNCKKESSRHTYRTTWNPKCGDCIKWKKFLWWSWCAEYQGCWNTETFEFGDVQMTK